MHGINSSATRLSSSGSGSANSAADLVEMMRRIVHRGGRGRRQDNVPPEVGFHTTSAVRLFHYVRVGMRERESGRGERRAYACSFLTRLTESFGHWPRTPFETEHRGGGGGGGGETANYLLRMSA